MNNILIIYPHWPPANLAGVQRPRLLGNFLPEFGWQPIILTVKPEYYEETPDPDLARTVSDKIIVHYVNAFSPPKKVRLIGDIALRAFFHLLQGAREIIKNNKISFIYIPIPIYYTAVLGRILHEQFKIPYGIDYIDPWSNGIPGAAKIFSRAWMANQIAKTLEPFAVKKAALITGVSTSYYQYVLDNYLKNKKVAHVGMPYGFDANDHSIKLPDLNYPWANIAGCKPLIYAGAFLPKSHLYIQCLFKVIKRLNYQGLWDPSVHLYFLGTGENNEKTIAEYAAENEISEYIHEEKSRFPYIQILNFLADAFGVMIIGSTERHYTASKTFQAILSKRPVFAIFHKESSAIEVMREAHADEYLVEYEDYMTNQELENRIYENFNNFINQKFAWNPSIEKLDKFSARSSALKLAEKLNEVIK